MILCLDIGGSRIKAAHAASGILLPLGEAPTPLQDTALFVAVLRRFVAVASGQDGGVDAIAISIAGIVAPDSGRITVANIPCIDRSPLAQDLAASLGLPVLVLNDADCFALAEANHGAGQGHDTVFGVILGTGVGGGVVINGQVLTGKGGYSGEWGHGPIVAVPDLTLPCGCGQSGCLDTLGGARGMERLHEIREGRTIAAPEIIAGWRAKDESCLRTIDLWVDVVSGPLAMAVNLLGAGVVPVGGGLSNAADLVQRLDKAVRARILRQTDQPLVVPAMCGADAGLIGAAAAGAQAFARAPC